MSPKYARRALRIHLDQEVENRLTFAAADRKHAMRGNRLHRLAVVVIHLEFLLRIHPIHGLPANDHAFVVQQPAQRLAHLGVLGDALSDDMPCPLQRILDRRHLPVFLHEGRRKIEKG